MAKTASATVKARQAAMAALLAQEQERLEATASAVVEVAAEHEAMAALEVELAERRASFRAAVDRALGFGKSPEELAVLSGVPVAAVRPPKRAPKVSAETAGKVLELAGGEGRVGGAGAVA